MVDNKHDDNNSYDNNLWESGIRFAEVKKPKRYAGVIGVLLLTLFSAAIGGIIGGYYVKKSVNVSYYGFNQDDSLQDENKQIKNNLSKNPETETLPKNTITKVAETIGPAVVGVNSNTTTWNGGIALLGSGSGIIFDKRGYILTNEHVIEGATNISVTLSGGRRVAAKIIGKDSKTDLAILKVDVDNLPVAKFGNSTGMRVGDVAVAVGNPLGEEFSGTVTVGVISAVNRNIEYDGRNYKLIQTDASINAGNSGGALCNEAGEIIGIITLKIKSLEGMGFAISINDARPIIEGIMKNGYVKRPSLGIISQFIDESTSVFYSVPVGVYVQDVVKDDGRDSIGLQSGDIIVSFDNKQLESDGILSELVSKHKIGESITARVWRDGKVKKMKVKLVDSYGQ
jgi:serine protease Do